MKYDPSAYQMYAIKYIKDHPYCAVFLDCGLGKTAITLTAIHQMMFDSFEVHKVLVVAPLHVVENTWPKEIAKWDNVKDFKFSVVMGSEKQRLSALGKEADIYIINRENLKWLVEDSCLPFDFDMVVLDELSTFKNPQSKRFKSFLRVRPKVKRVVGLTGTPAPNGLMDLWAEFKVIDLGQRLGRFITKYRINYFEPDKQDHRNGIVYSYKPREGAEEKIYKAISDITVSMRATDNIKMPELVSSEYKVYMSSSLSSLYEDFKKSFTLGNNITASNAAVLCGKLGQFANGCVYNDSKVADNIHNLKLDALQDIVEACEGHPFLLVYWYKHDLERIKQRLDFLKVGYREIKDSNSIEDWNNKKIPVGLIHPASAGHGLNLQEGSNHMVFFGLTWSLEFYQQTVARLYRQGQTKDTVVIQHIVTAGTIDERIMQAIKMKAMTQDALVNAVKAEVEVKNDKEH